MNKAARPPTGETASAPAIPWLGETTGVCTENNNLAAGELLSTVSPPDGELKTSGEKPALPPGNDARIPLGSLFGLICLAGFMVHTVARMLETVNPENPICLHILRIT